MKITIQKFNVKKMKKGSTCLILGNIMSGKTFLVRDILYHHRAITDGTVMSPLSESYSDIVPTSSIYNEYEPEIIREVISKQKQKFITTYSGGEVDFPAFLVMDDCLYPNRNINQDKYLKDVFMTSRKYELLVLLTTQRLLGLGPMIRSNIDYVFIGRCKTLDDQRRIYEYYAGMFPSFEIFQQVLERCTRDYGFLVIDNCSSSNRIEDQIFQYKAKKHKNIRFTSKINLEEMV